MLCKFCGQDKKLIKAHIIPAGIFRRLKKSDNSLEMMTNKRGEFKKRLPIGVYDKTIVCKECEHLWQEWDTYAQNLLIEEFSKGQMRAINDKNICCTIDKFDYKKLKLFFISLAWRASVSSHPFYSKISLGKFEDLAKRHIIDNNPGNSEDFSVTLAKFDDPLAKILLDPHSDEYSNVGFMRFYLAGYIAYIKVDVKPTPMPLSPFILSENKPLHIILRDFRKSKELDLIKSMLKS